jgi:hypothetical protein
MTQLWADCRYLREVVFADARWTVEGYAVLLGRRTRFISPVIVLLIDFNKHNVMDPFSQNVFNFIALLCPSYPLRHGFPTRGQSCELCTLKKCHNKLDRYFTYCYISMNRPADQTVITGVAFRHKRVGDPCSASLLVWSFPGQEILYILESNPH